MVCVVLSTAPEARNRALSWAPIRAEAARSACCSTLLARDEARLPAPGLVSRVTRGWPVVVAVPGGAMMLSSEAVKSAGTEMAP